MSDDKTYTRIDMRWKAIKNLEFIITQLDQLTSDQHDLIVKQRAANTRLQAEITRLQAALDALRQFSTHRHNCGLSKALNHPSYTGKCNCGLTKALAKAETP